MRLFLVPPLVAAAGHLFVVLIMGAKISVFLSRGTEKAKQTLTISISSHLSDRSVALFCISTALQFRSGSTVDPLCPIRRYTSLSRLAEQILLSAAVQALHGRRQRGEGKVAVTQRGGGVTALV